MRSDISISGFHTIAHRSCCEDSSRNEADDVLNVQEPSRRISDEVKKKNPDTAKFIRAGVDGPPKPEQRPGP